MSQENVEAFTRALEAANRRDFEAVLEGLDPEVEWHPGLAVLLGGEATVYRGLEGARKTFQDLYGYFAELQIDISEIRDLGDRLLAIGQVHARGAESGVEIESPWAYLVRFKSGKAIWVRSYTDMAEAREAAGLSE